MFDQQNLHVPFEIPIPDGLSPGKMVIVKGEIPSQSQRFAVNLLTRSGDIALQVGPNFIKDRVIRNSVQHMMWGEEESSGPLPVYPGTNFELTILCEAYDFKISFNGKHFTEFKHRAPFSTISNLEVEGDVVIFNVNFKEQSDYGNSNKSNSTSLGFQTGPPASNYNSGSLYPSVDLLPSDPSPGLKPSTGKSPYPSAPYSSSGGGPYPNAGGGSRPNSGGGFYPSSGGGPYPSSGGGPYPSSGGGPYPSSGGGPYPSSGGGPYPSSGGGPYPSSGGGLYPSSGGGPYPSSGGGPYPSSGGGPYPSPGGGPYPSSGGGPYPSSGGGPYPTQPNYGNVPHQGFYPQVPNQQTGGFTPTPHSKPGFLDQAGMALAGILGPGLLAGGMNKRSNSRENGRPTLLDQAGRALSGILGDSRLSGSTRSQRGMQPNSPTSQTRSGILDQAGSALAGILGNSGLMRDGHHNRNKLGILGGALGTAAAGAALTGHLNPVKATKKQLKAHKKALKYGLPLAGAGLGAYALHKGLKKGFRRSSSSSSSSSSD